MRKITRHTFKVATGRKPVDDDLERCNCPKAGEIGHLCCGWDEEANLPNFETYGLRIRDYGSHRGSQHDRHR